MAMRGMYLNVMVADPIKGLLLEVLPLVPCLEAVHEREHYHHRDTTDAAGLEWRGENNISHHLYLPNFFLYLQV